jgi:hypothetical protein
VIILGPLASIMGAPADQVARATSRVSKGLDLSGGAMGASATPPRGAFLYEQALRCGKFVLVLPLPSAQLVRAETSINSTMPMRLDLHLASTETTAIAA